MPTTLHEQLRDLADEAGQSADPALGRELWRRGRRYSRRRRTGDLVIAGLTLVLLAVITGAAWQRAAPPPEPVPADAPAGLPDRIYRPSKWLPGTDEDGPLAQLAALIPQSRGAWTGNESGVVGISATTGEYRFLDMPGYVGGGASLAPDGRHVAYWITGEPSATPLTPEDGGDPVGGVAIYDTATGESRSHRLTSPHGISTEVLTWIDSGALLISYLHFVGGDDASLMDQSSANSPAVLEWRLADPAPKQRTPIGREAVFGPDDAGISSYDRTALSVEGDIILLGDRIPRGLQRRFPGPDVLPTALAVDPTGTRLAAARTGNSSPNRLVVARLPARGESAVLDLEGVPERRRCWTVLGWTDQDHLAALCSRGSPDAGLDKVAVVEVDVATGAWTVLVRGLGPVDHWSIGWATDLWSESVLHAERPPSPIDPRIPVALASMTFLLGGAAFVLWRRRVRP
jgi:hypothetical protein